MSEILAPAGDKNSALAAINAGTDAIYLGLKQFSARNSAENFGYDEFAEIVKRAHLFGVKVYVAMNTLIKNCELEDFFNSAINAWNGGADAIIISDIFAGKYLKQNCPHICLHLSTQAGVCNEYGARLAKEYGFDRVILARETAIDDIKKIAGIIETEVFIQGALCTCFSGQCYFSSFAGGNSGNRGRCKQPCRKKYFIDREGFEETAYRLSLSDLSVGEDIKKLISSGVFSFKIEGRMRRPEYVSAAVKYYRSILDGSVAVKRNLSDLKRAYNRGNYTGGLAFGQDKNFISSAVQGHIGEFVGVIKVENGKFTVKTEENFTNGDGFKILRNGKEVGGASFAGKIKGGFALNCRERLKNGDKVFITTDTALNSRLSAQSRKLPLKISAEFFSGTTARITINGYDFYGEKPLEKAEKRPLTEEEIENSLKKTDKLPFEISFEQVETDGVFIPASELNALRRNAFNRYYEIISQNNNVKIEKTFEIPAVNVSKNAKTAVIGTDLNGASADIGILKLNDFSADFEKLTKDFNGEKFLYLPPYLSGAETEKIKPLIKNFDGIYCDGIYGFQLAQELNIPLFAGTGINLSNAVGVSFCNAKYIALSKELTAEEARPLATQNSFYFTAGNIKVMDLIYCPFEKKCASCDKRNIYTLTDENGRKFPLRRYKCADNCRFEVYNCANLVSTQNFSGKLFDCTLEENAAEFIRVSNAPEELKRFFNVNFTRGHTAKPIE